MFDVRKVGAHISNLRKQKNMTQSMLADKLNVTRQAVSRYEKGDSFPDISVLVLIAETFATTIDDLIRSGGPTKAEELLLGSDINNTDIPRELFRENITEDILNIAPFLKPDLLDRIAKGFGRHGMDISKLIALAEYMNEDSFLTMMENADFNELDITLLEKFIPFFSEQSKMTIFEKILDGEIDSRLISVLFPYAEYLREQIETAVLYGVIDSEAMKILKEEKNQGDTPCMNN